MTSTIQDRFNIVPEEGVKAPCRMSSISNLTLSGLQTVDGIVGAVEDRVLAQFQTDGTENGIYVMRSTAWVRASDWDDNTDILSGILIPVSEGALYSGTVIQALFSGVFSVGTTSVSFSVVSAESPINTVAEMTAKGNLQVGGVVETAGFYAAGDGGGGFYTVIAGTGTANGYNIIAHDTLAYSFVLQVGRSANVAQFGAKGDGTADDTSACQAAIDYCETNAIGLLEFNSGIYIVTGIVLPAEVILKGQGTDATTLKLKASSNSDVIATKDFDTLAGSNKWFTDTEGVPSGFGICDMSIDGNKANNTSGYGIRIYGKRYLLKNVYIRDCVNDGLYTECAAKGGQNDYKDAPECDIESLWVRDCEGNGITYRGPHDGRLDKLYPHLNAGKGISFEDSVVYGGSADVGFIHSYANDQGAVFDARVSCQYLQSESSYKEGVVNNNSDTQIDALRVFKSWRDFEATEAPAANKSVDLAAACRIGTAKIRTDNGGTALSVTSSGSHIGFAEISGEGKNGIGIDLASSLANISARIFDFNGGTGTGIKHATTGTTNGNRVTFTSRSCDTHFNNVTGSQGNFISGDIYTAVGEVAVTGLTPNPTEDYNLISRGDTAKQTFKKGSATVLAGATFIDVPHNLLFTPSGEDIQVTASSNIGTSGFWISTVGATTFRINMTAAPAGNKIFLWDAHN